MEMYLDTLGKYMENARNEPSDTTDYQAGLVVGVDEVVKNNIWEKQELVEGLTDKLEQELKLDEPNYNKVRGMVTSLKVALKQEGELELDKYVVETLRGVMVKDAKGNVVPKDFVKTETYTEEWTMPEILVYDILYPEFARKI